MPNHASLKDQILHILSGTVIFVFIGLIAVLLDLAATMVRGLGVSEFTYNVLNLTAHSVLVLDVLLFLLYLITSSMQLVKGMFK